MKWCVVGIALVACGAAAHSPQPPLAPIPPAPKCPETWQWRTSGSGRATVLTEGLLVPGPGPHCTVTGTRRTCAPSPGKTRTYRHGATLRIDVPSAAYVLHGPDVREQCTSNAGTETCSPTMERASYLERLDESGRATWSLPTNADESDAAILVADARGAYVTVFSPYAACATVRAFSPDGRKLWETFVGCMTYAHSAYSNDVQVVLEPDCLLVWGAESMGRYVTGLDLRTGETLCEHVFDRR